MAGWLNNTFYNFDRGIFIMTRNLFTTAGGFFTPIFKVLTFLGNGGWFFILLSVILLLFKKTRKIGVAVLLSLGVGAILTNIALKNLVARPRPYLVNSEYRVYWLSAWGKAQSEMSFPSGHATASMASAMAFFLAFNNKKWRWVGFVLAFLIGLTRVYFVVHYATDVIAGFIVGSLSGVLGNYLMNLIFNCFEKNKDKKAVKFILNADLLDLIKK